MSSHSRRHWQAVNAEAAGRRRGCADSSDDRVVGAPIFGEIYVVLAPAGWIDGDDAFDIFYRSTRENLVHTALAAQGVG